MNIREATCTDAAGIARVHVESWRTTYCGIVPEEFLAQLSYEQRADQWRRELCDGRGATFLYVAEKDAGEIVGFAAAGRQETDQSSPDGELFAIYLLESFQHRGLGRELVRPVADRFRRDGIHSMGVWVLADNPARDFYAALGGKPIRRQTIDLGGKTLDEIAYGWEHLNDLRV